MTRVPPPGGGGGGKPPPAPKPEFPYRNPLRGISGLVPERIDMGVDYAGTGPVYALGPGVITAAGHAWSGAVGAPVPGTWITERITEGPLTGYSVYVAEDIGQIQVRTGQKVDSSTILGYLESPGGTMGGGQMETGFAAMGQPGTQGETAAAAAGQQATGGDPGAFPTAYGVAYSTVLGFTGAKEGTTGGTPTGSIPPALIKALQALNKGGTTVGGQITPGGPSFTAPGGQGVAGAIGGLVSWLDRLSAAVDWLLNPGHWVRILAGIGGGVLVLAGTWQLSHTGGDVPRPAALPVGMLLVGLGAVGLFVAFHNLPPDVTGFPGLLGYLNTQIHTPVSTK